MARPIVALLAAAGLLAAAVDIAQSIGLEDGRQRAADAAWFREWHACRARCIESSPSVNAQSMCIEQECTGEVAP